MAYPQIIAHRGASADAPENTFAAIELAWKQNADGIEVDTHITKDGHLVVIHDGNTKRTGRKKLIVKKSTLAQLQKIDVGNKKYPNQRIPLLNEVIHSLPRDKELFIELKSKDKRLIPTLLKLIKNPTPITIISFSLPQLATLKKKAPQLKTYWILSKQINDAFFKIFPSPWAKKIIQHAKKSNIDGLDFNGALLTKNRLKLLKIYRTLTTHALHENLKLAAWTVDSPLRAATLAHLGVTHITTNRPSLLKKFLLP